MKINYVTIAQENFGSYRYHIKTPALELKKLGHNVSITQHPIENCDAYIFHKHLRYSEHEMMRELKREHPNCKNYFIACDYHLDTKHREHYLKMINGCDVLVVCTEAMREILKEETGRDGVVIKDPWGIEFEEQKPFFRKKKRLNLLWFGSQTNLDALSEVIDGLGEHDVTVVADKPSGWFNHNEKVVRFVNYSIEALRDEFNNCDVVIIPQQVDRKRRQVKTHNRLVDSIRAGKFTIASPVSAYKELGDYCYLGEIRDGLEWLATQPSESIESKIALGQEHIRKEFSPEKIGRDWENLLYGKRDTV